MTNPKPRNRIAEVNIGIICSCLPILPALYKHVAKAAKAKVSSHTSAYYELEGVGHKSVNADGAAPSDKEPGKVDRVQALAKQYLGPGNSQVSAGVVTAGLENSTPTDELWGGDGILKTVKLEQKETQAPRPRSSLLRPAEAVLPIEQAHAR